MPRQIKKPEIPNKYTNDWLEKLDGRTRVAQVVHQRFQTLTADLGGMDSLSYKKISLCRRALYLEALIEQQEAALARGEDVDHGRLTNTTNTLMGLYKALGLDRQAKDVPDLQTYLKQRATA